MLVENRIVKRRWLLIVSAIAMLCIAQSALGQSGRRQTRTPPPPPAPVPTETKTDPATGPTTSTPVVKPATLTSVLVSGDRYGSSLYIHPGYIDEVINACVDRLENSASLEIKSGGHMNRKDASDRAKKETVAYVLWIELRVENDDMNDISVGYYVFKPGTAKGLTSGRVYPGSHSAGRVIVGVPSISRRLPIQYQLREGGQQIADRVRDKLRDVGLPD